MHLTKVKAHTQGTEEISSQIILFAADNTVVVSYINKEEVWDQAPFVPSSGDYTHGATSGK